VCDDTTIVHTLAHEMAAGAKHKACGEKADESQAETQDGSDGTHGTDRTHKPCPMVDVTAEAEVEKRAESALGGQNGYIPPPAEAGGNRNSPLKRANLTFAIGGVGGVETPMNR
jgi:hypothetical protein